MQRAKSVDDYIANASAWRNELLRLREVLLATPLSEAVKWGGPCYTHNGKNVVGIAAFRSYFGLWFYQGALLRDDESVLINAQEGKTKALRQWRMASGRDIKPAMIMRYVREAMSLVDRGREIKPDRAALLEVPAELRNALRRAKGATAAFRRLRPGLQREYTDYVTYAKLERTKRDRIARILPMIEAGIGLNDKYRQK